LKIPAFIKDNLLLKMTSLNTLVIGVRLVVSFFIQRLLAQLVGEVGIYKIGQLRSLSQLLMSFTSLGVFNGIVKYVSEHKEDKVQLQRLFSSTFVFTTIGTLVTAVVLFIFSKQLSDYLFGSQDFVYLIKIMVVVAPCIAIQRVFNGVVNGLSKYKQFAKIELVSYLISATLTIVLLFQYNIDGALIAIAITPVIQVTVMFFLFIKVLKEYVQFSKLTFSAPFAKSLLAFSLMSFVSTILLNYIEIDIRVMLADKLTEVDAGIWTAMTFISKNYMVFSGSIFTLYIIPKFAGIHTKKGFKTELFVIYKTLLPIFAVGMVLVYVLRSYVIDFVYPGFETMAPLFKWQLMGDFIRLASLVLAHQFLAKKMVRNFIFSEILSLVLFYGLASYLSSDYGIEGVVMAHFIRYIIYFLVVLYLVFRYFRKQPQKEA
jgi:O-antigen/teichoic acid export membrane protein